MYGYLMCVAAAALGIDVGWQRLPEGGLQYLIQIKPEMLDSLKAGVPIESDIPPTVKDIRGYRITVGNLSLPHDAPPLTAASPAPPASGEFRFGGAPGQSITVGPPSATPYPTSPAPSQFTPMPRTLSPEPGKPLAEQPASFVQSSTTTALPGAVKTDAQSAAAPAADTSSRLWTYLTGALVALCGSLAWNGYLLWMLREARRRYRAMLDGDGNETADDDDDDQSMRRG